MPSSPVTRLLLLALFIGCGWSAALESVPPSHVVQPGDTVFSLARTWGLTVPQLLELSHLNDTALKVGQVLMLTPPTSTPHTVQAGETLYSLARSVGMTPDELQVLNGLPGPALQVGQRLWLPTRAVPNQTVPNTPPAAVSTAPVVQPAGADLSVDQVTLPPRLPDGSLAVPADVPDADWLNRAMSLIGVPYRYGGSSPGGTDCSGLVLQIFAPMGLNLPRQSTMQAQVGLPVEQADLQAGDLVFFDTEGRGAVTHDGVYLGEGAFIHANSYNGRVAINRLSEPYYANRYLSARRVLGQILGAG